MADEFVDNFAEDVDGDLEAIQEEPEVFENQVDENQDDKDEDETKTLVKPKKRIFRPQVKLDATRLVGARGIGILESTFKDFKLKGKGHELEDLNKTMRALEHWAHRLYPKMSFDDCIDKIEDLGFKKNVMVHVTKIRLGMEDDIRTEPDVIEEPMEEPEADPFDALMSSVPAPPKLPELTEEQKARMLRNRLIAEEIRMKKMKERQEALKAKEAEEEASMLSLKSTEDNYIPPESIEIS